MSEADFLDRMQDVLDMEDGQPVAMDMALAGCGTWDSTAMVSFMAVANVSGGKHVTMTQVMACKTVADLYALAR